MTAGVTILSRINSSFTFLIDNNLLPQHYLLLLERVPHPRHPMSCQNPLSLSPLDKRYLKHNSIFDLSLTSIVSISLVISTALSNSIHSLSKISRTLIIHLQPCLQEKQLRCGCLLRARNITLQRRLCVV
jgi:hypothetical protein